MAALDNANPLVFGRAVDREVLPEELDDGVRDEIDAREVFDLLRSINDPEHPLTLEELNVLQEGHIEVDDPGNSVEVLFTPTIPHCSMATLIGKVAIICLSGNGTYTPNEAHTNEVYCLIFDTNLPPYIGLSIRVRLLRALPPRFKVDIRIRPGTHTSEEAVNKQLADKERVAAALENTHLLEVVNQCLDIKE